MSLRHVRCCCSFLLFNTTAGLKLQCNFVYFFCRSQQSVCRRLSIKHRHSHFTATLFLLYLFYFIFLTINLKNMLFFCSKWMTKCDFCNENSCLHDIKKKMGHCRKRILTRFCVCVHADTFFLFLCRHCLHRPTSKYPHYVHIGVINHDMRLFIEMNC